MRLRILGVVAITSRAWCRLLTRDGSECGEAYYSRGVVGRMAM